MKYVICAVALLPSLAQAQAVPAKPDTRVPSGPKIPNPNGFDLYVRASKLIESAKHSVDAVDDANPPADAKARAQRYSLKRRQAWLKKNATGFALFQKALHTPTRHPNHRKEGWTWGGEEPYALLRQLARDKAIERNTREMQGDWGSAMKSRIDIVQMGTDVGRGGFVISGLVSVAIQAIGREAPWDATEKLNLAQTRAAIARLQPIYNRRLRYEEVLQEEKYYGLASLRMQMRNPGWPLAMRWHFATDWDSGLAFEKRLLALKQPTETVLQNYAHMMDINMANARLPMLAKKIPFAKQTDPYTEMVKPVFTRGNLNFARNDAGNSVWLCALALRAYKLENRKYPVSLNELAPRYLKQIPADPFGGGEKLRYKRTNNSYLLWSIGPDGKDDGGKPIPYSKKNKPKPGSARRLPFLDLEGKGDYVAGKNR